MKVKAIIEFNDKVENVLRKVGDIFDCNEERGNFLLDNKAVELVKEVKENGKGAKKTKARDDQ